MRELGVPTALEQPIDADFIASATSAEPFRTKRIADAPPAKLSTTHQNVTKAAFDPLTSNFIAFASAVIAFCALRNVSKTSDGWRGWFSRGLAGVANDCCGVRILHGPGNPRVAGHVCHPALRFGGCVVRHVYGAHSRRPATSKSWRSPPQCGLFLPMFLIVPLSAPLVGFVMCGACVGSIWLAFDYTRSLFTTGLLRFFLLENAHAGISLGAATSLLSTGRSAELARGAERIHKWPILAGIALWFVTEWTTELLAYPVLHALARVGLAPVFCYPCVWRREVGDYLGPGGCSSDDQSLIKSVPLSFNFLTRSTNRSVK